LADENPYVGPASFGEQDRGRFFGRDDEARELSYLLIARPAVLLYAQSGAGKTSLLQAKVVPDLRESGEMHVLPITRVSGPAEDGNVYVANALTRLKLTTATLTDALASCFTETQDGEDPIPYLLIIDQFEEIFTFRPELAAQRLEFFEQLRDCLAAYPNLGLLLSMREDYLADMDSFAGYLPDRLRTRMRMERLSDKQAEDAIGRPAADAGKPFAADGARRLADDLRRVQTSRGPAASATAGGHALGKYVEPVQLQIVCRQLWSKLPDGATAITAEQIETLARVDDALTNFYRDALTAVRETLPALRERTLRQWFGKRLITSAKTRGMVYQGKSETEELPNTAVEVLREKYILRPDIRASGTWYELAHDRLVEPILADNLAWRASYKNPVADALERGPDNLLTGSGLTGAIQFDRDNPLELKPNERRFLERSEKEEARARKRRRTLAIAVVVVILGLSGLASWAVIEKGKAERAEDNANKALVQSLVNSGRGLLSTNTEFDDLSSMLAVLRAERKLRDLPTVSRELRADVRGVLQKVVYGIQERNRLPVEDQVYSARFNRDGTRIGAVDEKGKIYIWDRSGTKLSEFQGPSGHISISSAAFTADLDFLVTVHSTVNPEGVIDSETSALVWGLKAHAKIAELKPLGGPVWAADIDPGGRFIATAGDGGLRVWNFQGVELEQWGTFPEHAIRVAFSPEGNRLAWESDAGVRILDLDNPGAVRTLIGRTAPKHATDEEVSVAFVPGHEQLVAAGQVWDLRTFSAIGKAGEGSIFSPDGRWVAKDDVAKNDKGTPEIATVAGNRIARLSGHTDGAFVMAFGPGHTVLTSGRDKTFRLWDLSPRFAAEFKSWRSTFSMASSDTPRFYATLDTSYEDEEKDKDFPMGIGRDNAITLWSPEGHLLGEFPTRPGADVSYVALSQDAAMLAVCYPDVKTCRLWDTKTKRSVDVQLEGEMVGIMMVSGKPALMSKDGVAVRVQDGSGPARPLFSLPPGTASVELNTARTQLVAASPSGVSVWDLSGQRVGGFEKQLAAGSTVLPGSDLQHVGIIGPTPPGTHAGETFVYNQDGKLIASFGKVPASALSPDGKLLATTGGYYAVSTLWDVESKRPVARFSGNGDFQLIFTPDGKFVTVVGNDAPARLWRVETTDELVTAACKWIGDYLLHNPDVSAEDRKLCGP
jgi:WD40 repeat protein